MKLTLKHYHEKVSVESESDDIGLGEVIQMFRQLLLAAGFQPDSIKEYLDEE